LIDSTGAGLDPEAQRPYVAEAAKVFNYMLPVIPIWENYSNNPLNEDLVSNAPGPDDPIWANTHSGPDNFITYLALTGVIGPGQ